VGCGTGEALVWLRQTVGETGSVLGVDLAAAHVEASIAKAGAHARVVQQDALTMKERHAFDFIWSVNTLNHFRDAVVALKQFTDLLAPKGYVAIGQSSFLPDMFLAWDYRLESRVTAAERQYYRDRYNLTEEDTTGVRCIVGRMRLAGL